MIAPNDFQSRVTQLQTALSDKMRVRGATLERQLRRAAATILGAQDWMAHPKLARVLDLSCVNKAFSDLDAHLARIDPVEERKTALLRLIGVIVIRLMGLAALIYAILRWRGLN